MAVREAEEFLEIPKNAKEKECIPRIGLRATIINRITHQPIAYEIDKLHGSLNLFVKLLSGKLAYVKVFDCTAILPDGQSDIVLNLVHISKLTLI